MGKSDLELTKDMQGIAEVLSVMIERMSEEPKNWCLVIFDEDDKQDSVTQYIANCDRNRVGDALMGIVKAWMEGMPDRPHDNMH